MSALHLHPEELLDKAAAGALSESEQARLDQHLAQCAVCRFELSARADFAAAAAPVGDVQVDDLVARALAGMPAKESAPRRVGSMRYVAAAAVVTVGLASFGAVLVKLAQPEVERPVSAAGAKVGARGARAVETVQQAPVPPEAIIEAPPEVPEPTPVAEVPAPAPRVQKRVAVAAPREADAAEVFQAGNTARIRGDRAEAALRYAELLRKFPSSDEARLTHAMFGRMLLDTGDARGALQQLDAYLETGDGTLREEAMTARARALALLGRTGDEAAAWDALLQQYPDSVHAERATARLRELGMK